MGLGDTLRWFVPESSPVGTTVGQGGINGVNVDTGVGGAGEGDGVAVGNVVGVRVGVG